MMAEIRIKKEIEDVSFRRDGGDLLTFFGEPKHLKQAGERIILRDSKDKSYDFLETDTLYVNDVLFPGNAAVKVAKLRDEVFNANSGNGEGSGITTQQAQTSVVPQVTATNAIPFNAPLSVIASLTLSGPVVFTKNTTGATAGYAAMRRVVSNGVNIPDTTAFKMSSGSRNFSNVSGDVNLYLFWFDRVDYWVSIETYVTPPVVSSIAIENTTPTKINLTYNEPLLISSVPVIAEFSTGMGKTITNVQLNGSTVELTVLSAYVEGGTETLTYTGTSIRDGAGNSAPTFSGAAVTNNVTTPVETTVHLSNFTGTDQTLITAYTPETGSAWTNAIGSFKIVTNAAFVNAFNAGSARMTTETSLTNIKATVVAKGRDTGIIVLLPRYTDANNYVQINFTPTQVQCYYKQGGALSAAFATGAITNNTEYESYEIEVSGTNIKVSLGGVELINATIPVATTGTKFGVEYYNASNGPLGYYDSVKIIAL